MVVTGINKGVCPFDVTCGPFEVFWWQFHADVWNFEEIIQH